MQGTTIVLERNDHCTTGMRS